MALLDQIDEFQTTMNHILEMVEESKALASQIPEASLSEAPSKIREIFEACENGVKALQEAIGQAEDIQRTLGG
jgi:methyl-accepting chemotaxis protein